MRISRTRLAAMLLLLIWVGPVSFVQTDTWQLLKLVGAPARASADAQVIPAGMAMVLEPNTPITLRLRDGSILDVRFLRRVLLDSMVYAQRFEARASSSSYVPFTLGEPLHVSLRDGREWTAPFAGYAELTLLVRSSDGSYLRAPFEFVSEIRRANGARIEPADLAQAFRAELLPSAEALELQRRVRTYGMASPWGDTFRVAVEDIASATATSSETNVGGIVVLTLMVTVVLVFVLIGAAIHSAKHQKCGGTPTTGSSWLSRVHLTTRPFDRSRGSFVGDPLAVADSWPGAPESGPATVAADSRMSPLDGAY